MSRVDVLSETIINRPLQEVCSFASNPDNAPRWYVNIKSAEWQTPKPLVVGSRIAFVAHFLGRKLSYVYEITEWQEGKRLVMRTAQGPFPMETTYAWEAIDNARTRMTLRNCGTPAGFSKLLAPLMIPAMKRANKKDLALLKQILELTQQ